MLGTFPHLAVGASPSSTTHSQVATVPACDFFAVGSVLLRRIHLDLGSVAFVAIHLAVAVAQVTDKEPVLRLQMGKRGESFLDVG